MKKILFLLLTLVSLSASAQTANYTAGSSAAYETHSKTIVWNLYDTLSGANDTLLVSFPGSVHQYAIASVCATWLATGTTSSSSVVLQGRNASHETWQTISTATYAAEVTSACDSDPVPYIFTRLMAVSAANIAHLRISVALKRA